MSPLFHRDYLTRLPLPLAQLYARAHNAKDARGRHDNTFYLFEAWIKLTASVLGAAYLENHNTRQTDRLDSLLSELSLPSLGHWVQILREVAEDFSQRPDAATHPLGHVWAQYTLPRKDLPGMLALHRRIKNGADAQPSNHTSCSVRDVIDALVTYRNTVFGHGAGREEAFYNQEMGPLLFPAVNDLLAESTIDALGPRGTRLMFLTGLRALDDENVELARRELAGLQGERLDPVILNRTDADTLAPQVIAVAWPGRGVPLRLDPLLAFRESETSDEMLFLNRDRNGKQVEYLSYTTGRTERNASMGPALVAMLGKLRQPREGSSVDNAIEGASQPAFEGTSATHKGDYEIIHELGRGGMGVVYLARQASLGRTVALKMLSPELAGDEVALSRFRREMRALARCDHPNIVKVLASGTMPDGSLYYTMEHVPGCDLEEVWRALSADTSGRSSSSLGSLTLTDTVRTLAGRERRARGKGMAAGDSSNATADVSRSTEQVSAEGVATASVVTGSVSTPSVPSTSVVMASDETPVPAPSSRSEVARRAAELTDDPGGYVRRVAGLIRDAALALQSVHEQGIVHRDVKPANLMLTADGSRVVLMDFGLAKESSAQLTSSRAGGLLGTMRYAAPEQLAAASLNVGAPADVRGLGVTLWELLTRKRLFSDAADEKQLAMKVHETDVPRLREIDPGFDADLEAIVARAVERRASDRIQSARLLADYLQSWLDGKPIPLRVPNTTELMRRWMREHKALGGSAIGVVVALCLGMAGTTWQSIRATRAEKRATANEQRAIDQSNRAERERAIAEKRFDLVRSLANVFLFETYDRIRYLPASGDAVTHLIGVADQYLQQLQSEGRDDPRLLYDIGAGYIKLADIQSQQARRDETLATLQKALGLFKRLQEIEPGNTDALRGLSAVHFGLSQSAFTRGELNESIELARTSVRYAQDYLKLFPTDNEALRHATLAHHQLGSTLFDKGEWTGGLATMKEAVEYARRRQLLAPDSIDAASDYLLEVTHYSQILTVSGDRAGAEKLLTEVEDVADAQRSSHPSDTRFFGHVGRIQKMRGEFFLQRGELPEALARLQRAREAFAEVCRFNPSNIHELDNLLVTIDTSCRVMGQADEKESLRQCADEYAKRAEDFLALAGNVPKARAWKSSALLARGQYEYAMGRTDTFVKLCEDAALVLQLPDDITQADYALVRQWTICRNQRALQLSLTKPAEVMNDLEADEKKLTAWQTKYPQDRTNQAVILANLSLQSFVADMTMQSSPIAGVAARLKGVKAMRYALEICETFRKEGHGTSQEPSILERADVFIPMEAKAYRERWKIAGPTTKTG